MTKQDVIKHLAHKIIICKTTGESWADCVSVDALEMATQALQEPERNKAQWIEDGYYDEPCVCSRCGQPGKYEWLFCPNCGAEMEEK